MKLASFEILTFTAEEKKEIDLALNNILDDLEALWSISPMESVYKFYDLKYDNRRELLINKDGIKIVDSGIVNSGDEIVLEKFGKKNKRPKINNYTEIFYFIKQYEEIRRGIERKIEKARSEKQQGIEAIIDIRNKYAKAATIEIEVPETINQHTLTVKQENGEAIGEIRMGAVTIRIITKGSIVVANKREPEKDKSK